MKDGLNYHFGNLSLSKSKTRSGNLYTGSGDGTFIYRLH